MCIRDRAKTGSRRPNETQWYSAANDVVTIWKERGLDVNIEDLVVDFAGRKPNSSGYGNDYGTAVTTKYLTAKISKHGVTTAQGFLGKLRTKLLGSEADQKELTKLAADKASLGRNRRKLKPLVQYLSSISGLLRSRAAFFVIANELSRFPGVTRGDNACLLYTSPSPRDRQKSRMPSSA